MQRHSLLTAFAALTGAAASLAQGTTSSSPLNDFLGGVNSVVEIIQSASASEAAAAATRSSSSSSSPTAALSSSPSATQASATASPSPTAAAAHHASNKTLIIAVVCAVVGAILLALILLGCCCCLMRRRRRARKTNGTAPIVDDEKNDWRSEKPQNPGRTYIPSQYGRIPSTENEPMIPPLAASGHTSAPSISTHPAYRPENPFVPVPPSPRRSAPSSRSGLTDGVHTADSPLVATAGVSEKQRLRSRSSSLSGSRPNPQAGVLDSGLPTHANEERPSTPFGLNSFGQPYERIGQPYEDMHVHVLQNDAPSQALHQSLNDRDPLMSAQPRSATPGWSTPPDGPSRSPRRSGQFTDSPYTTATSSTASEEYRSPPYVPAIPTPHEGQPYSHRLNYESQLEPQKPQQAKYMSQPQFPSSPNKRYSNSPTTMQPPPIPWNEPTEQRRQSPTRNSAQYAESGRRASRSPATSINGQPRRLRFSDLQASPTAPQGWDSRYGHSSYAQGGGVGEAM